MYMDINNITSSFRDAFPLYHGSHISAIHRALMEAQRDPSDSGHISLEIMKHRGRNAARVISALVNNGYPTLGEFQSASITKLSTVNCVRGKVLLPIMTAVHQAIQDVALLPGSPAEDSIPAELVIRLHASDDIKKILEDTARSEKWIKGYRLLCMHLCPSSEAPISVQTFLDLTPTMLMKWRNFGSAYTAHVVALQKRISLIQEV